MTAGEFSANVPKVSYINVHTWSSYGAGRFCNVSCSRRVGARARWDTKKQFSERLKVKSRPQADDSCEKGLVGEHVVVRLGKTVMRGSVIDYEISTDRHRYVHLLFLFVYLLTQSSVVDKGGKSRWMNFRESSVEFIDD